MASFAEPIVEFEVFIRHQVLVPAAQPSSEFCRISPKRNVIDRARDDAMVIDGVSHAKSTGECGRDRSSRRCNAATVLAPADSCPRPYA